MEFNLINFIKKYFLLFVNYLAIRDIRKRITGHEEFIYDWSHRNRSIENILFAHKRIDELFIELKKYEEERKNLKGN